MTTVKEITNKIEQFAPKYLAEDWDPIGLSFGSYDKKVNKVMVALDLDANTLKEAKDNHVDFIFTHHPTIFRPLATLNEMDERRKEFIELIRSDIALYSAHTNIDATENGMNDWLADALGLEKPFEVLDLSYQSDLKLLVLYTPQKNAETMRKELHQMGAGQVGEYKDVSYTSEGTGHFTPQSEANPTIGSKNEPEEVKEERVEMLFPSHLLDEVVQTIYTNHPYEEPVYHILDIGKKDKAYGIGRVGNLKTPVPFDDILKRVKETFNLTHVRHANMNLARDIKRIAILGGSGEKYYQQAINNKSDLFITGDISYHGAQDMIREGLAFIDAGHFIENIFVEKMSEKLEQWKKEEEWAIDIMPSKLQKDVFVFK